MINDEIINFTEHAKKQMSKRRISKDEVFFYFKFSRSFSACARPETQCFLWNRMPRQLSELLTAAMSLKPVKLFYRDQPRICSTIEMSSALTWDGKLIHKERAVRFKSEFKEDKEFKEGKKIEKDEEGTFFNSLPPLPALNSIHSLAKGAIHVLGTG